MTIQNEACRIGSNLRNEHLSLETHIDYIPAFDTWHSLSLLNITLKLNKILDNNLRITPPTTCTLKCCKNSIVEMKLKLHMEF